MPANKRLWLDTHHPVYDAMIDEWKMNQRRMMGGRGVLSELVRFDWELEGGDHYRGRMDSAVYLNFPDRFASLMVGHMMRQAPEPGNSLNFGQLGEVRRRRDIDEPTEAELFYYNTDGVGGDGSQWNAYWTTVGKAAVATGVHWILAEGPPEAPGVRAREIEQGLRPVLTDYDPTSVINWHYVNGRLAFAIIHRKVREIRVDAEGNLQNNNGVTEKMLLTRRGFNDLGTEFGGGGWFIFDDNHEVTEQGNYDLTGGEIPLVPLFYERVRPTPEHQSIARSGISELGNAAVAYMNLCSAADFDAWDGASSVVALLGVDEIGHNLFVTKVKGGNRFAPLKRAEDSTVNPDIRDASSGVVVSDVFDKRLKAKREEAIELMLNEIQSAPYASGESKKVSFTDTRAPRLALFAAELETAQNSCIYFVEQLWGKSSPSGSTEWPREFDLLDAAQVGKDFFDICQTAGVSSPTATTKAMMLVVKGLSISGDDEERTTIQSEFKASAELARDTQAAELKQLQQPPQPPAKP